MKTRELIAQLQAEDPSGELEVVADGAPVFFVAKFPAYYDGSLQILIRDASNPYYNVVGGKFTTHGSKIRIQTHSIEDAILDNPDLPVQFEGSVEHQRARVEQWRSEARLPL